MPSHQDALEAEARLIRERLGLIGKAAAAVTDPAVSRDVAGMLYVLVDSAYGGRSDYELRAGVNTSLDRLAEMVANVSDMPDCKHRGGCVERPGRGCDPACPARYTNANLLRSLGADDRINLLRDISGALWLLVGYVLPATQFFEHAEASRGDLDPEAEP
jgi:hypothetical protein